MEDINMISPVCELGHPHVEIIDLIGHNVSIHECIKFSYVSRDFNLAD